MNNLTTYYTILTRGQTAHVFVWQPVPSRWLRFDPETPGISYVATTSNPEEVRGLIARNCPGFRTRVRFCWNVREA